MHFTLAPRWLDPGETEGAITPFLILYAVHDALVKPMPAGPTTREPGRVVDRSPRTASSTTSLLRGGARFHNGDAAHARRT